MKDKGFQKGILFNHFPELLFFATELFDSNSDMLLKAARFITGDKALTSDKQIFRDIRKGEPDIADIKELFASTGFDAEKYTKEIEIYSIEPKEIGGWYVLLCLATGSKLRLQKRQKTEPKEDFNDRINYLNFLIEHCLLERKFFAETLKMDKLDNRWISDKIAVWLGIESVDLSASSQADKVQYLLSMILYWTALFDVYLQIEWKDKNIAKMLGLSLPRLNSKGKLCRSNEVFLESFVERWSIDNEVKNKFWSQLSIAIATARVKNDLPISSLKDELFDLNKPNEMIKKKLYRWRKGYIKNGEKYVNLITIDNLKQYLAIVYQDYDPTQIDSSIGCIIFLQLWELVQFECQKLDISNDIIVKVFSTYPRYVELIQQRYKKYEELGVLIP